VFLKAQSEGVKDILLI